jgi:phage terminase large subunit-like protein
MASTTLERKANAVRSIPWRNTAAGFRRFCEHVGYPLEPFQRKIAAACYAPERETLILLPRGNGKTTLMAAIAVHHLLAVPNPAVYVAASARDQAAILYESARGFASAVDGIVLRHLELRVPGGHLRVLASDAPKVHGLSPTLALVDEYHAHRDDQLWVALASARHKKPGARMITISTAGQGADSPLGRLRARALAGSHVRRSAALTGAQNGPLRMLEWALADDADPDDARAVKRANPASWITLDGIREQREALPDLAFQRFVANRWTERAGYWLPPGAWQACAADLVLEHDELELAHAVLEYRFEPGERIWVGVDLSGGGGRSDTAVVWVNERLWVGLEIWSGEHEPVTEVLDLLDQLASTFSVQEVTLDFWRAAGLAAELEQRGLTVSSYPQTDSRMIPASKRLHDAIVEGRLRHPNHPLLNEHVAAAAARHGRRGWRLDRADQPIDGVIALAMAVDRAEHREQPAKLLGWI